MSKKQINDELEQAELEIEELAMQLSDMLSAALYFSGVKKKNLKKAVDCYINGIDEVFGEDDEGEMGFEEVIQVIEHLKKSHPELF